MRAFARLVAAAGILVIPSLIGGCSGGKEMAPAPTATTAAGQYHCEMHPGVVSNEPGTCPRCKMALTKK